MARYTRRIYVKDDLICLNAYQYPTIFSARNESWLTQCLIGIARRDGVVPGLCTNDEWSSLGQEHNVWQCTTWLWRKKKKQLWNDQYH